MIVDMITAEEARTKVYVEIMNSDLRTAKKQIMNAIAMNKAGCILEKKHFVNAEATIAALKSAPLNYIVRQCPHPENEDVLFLQWERMPLDSVDDPFSVYKWPEL